MKRSEVGHRMNYIKNLRILTRVFLLTVVVSSCAFLQKKNSQDRVAIEPNPDSKNPSLYSDAYLQSDYDKKFKNAQENGPASLRALESEIFIKGNDASMRGEPKLAIFFLSKLHALKPQDVFIKRKLAIEYVRVAELEKSEKLLKDIYYHDQPGSETEGIILASVLQAQNKLAESRKIYNEVIIQHNSDEACLYLTKSYLLEKLISKAQNTLKKCARSNPEEPSYDFFLGKIEIDSGNIKNAEAFFRVSLKKDPSYLQSTLALGAIYENGGQTEKAKTLYRQFLEIAPQSVQAQVLAKLSQLYLQDETDFRKLPPEVIGYLETLTSLDPTDINVKVRLGLIYSEINKYDEAIKLFQQVLVVVPDSDKVLYYLGALYQELKRHEKAIEYYQKISPQSSLYNEASIQIAQLYALVARQSEGRVNENDFLRFVNERVKEKEELSFDLNLIQASYFEELLNESKAVEILLPMKDHKKFNENHAYYLATLLDRLNRFKDAREIIEQVLKKNPNNAQALNFLGYSLLEKNLELDLAFKYISKAVELKPQDGYIRDSLAWYYFLQGQYELALKESKKAQELVSNDSTISKHLGMIYEKLNLHDKALIYYRLSIDILNKNGKGAPATVATESEDLLKRISFLENIIGKIPPTVKRLPASK